MPNNELSEETVRTRIGDIRRISQQLRLKYWRKFHIIDLSGQMDESTAAEYVALLGLRAVISDSFPHSGSFRKFLMSLGQTIDGKIALFVLDVHARIIFAKETKSEWYKNEWDNAKLVIPLIKEG